MEVSPLPIADVAAALHPVAHAARLHRRTSP
jgi:hypothetical protein